MSKEMFKVEDSYGNNLGYYEAETKGQAKKAVISGIIVRKLSGAEIHSVYKAGYSVSDVVDGKVVETTPPHDPPATVQE